MIWTLNFTEIRVRCPSWWLKGGMCWLEGSSFVLTTNINDSKLQNSKFLHEALFGDTLYTTRVASFKTMLCQSFLFRLSHFAAKFLHNKQRKNEQLAAKKEAVYTRWLDSLMTPQVRVVDRLENYA